MTARPASRLIAAAALLALVASFLAPFPVQAEESPPPAEPAAEATLPPEAAAPEAEITPEAEATPVPTAAPPAEGEVPPTAEPALAEEPAAEPDLAGLIEAVPEGTTLAVVGENGTLLPLASEAAAEAIPTADPIWCPASVKAPTPNLNGCSSWFGSMTEMLAWLSDEINEPAMDGVIWIEQGVHGDGATLSLDGNLIGNDGFAIMSLYKLTLRGGWDQVTNKVLPGAHSDFHVRLQILDWGNDVTLSDILITGAPVGDDLVVQTAGNITLTRVQSSDNLGRGARLDNTSATTAKSVTISDSQFNGNDATGGLSVLSEGAITLTNVTAGYYDEDTNTSHGNTGYGVTLYNAYPGVTAGVTLKGLNNFSNNSGTGLTITSNGPITAGDLTASNNTGAGRGATLNNSSSPIVVGITLTGTNLFAGNTSTGLEAFSRGPIKINNLQAHASANGYGADLSNDTPPDGSAQPITLTGSSSFKVNFNTGLRIRSDGAVALNNLTANGNTNGRGVTIDNTNLNSHASPVTLTGTNIFSDNYFDGLTVSTLGAIKAANLTASGNALVSHSGYGLFLNNSSAATPLPVTLTGKTIASGNYDGGLYLNSDGAVSLQSLTASGNAHGAGARITNNADFAAPQKVTLSGTNVFVGNYGYGLNLDTYGAVTLSNLTASGNGTGPSGVGAFIGNTGATTAQKVTLTGTNVFRDNRNTGLSINSAGAIAASNLTATGNGVGFGGRGASMDNSAAAAAQTVTLSGKNVFSGNEGDGLYVFSIGTVSLASVTADSNIGYGATVDNSTGPGSPQKVTLSGTHRFADNAYDGLSVDSHGAITLSSTVATGNGQLTGNGHGVFLVNSGGTTPQPVTLSGSFLINGNDDYGLYIEATGIVKASNLTVRENEMLGVSIENTSLPTTAGITLSGTNRIEGNHYEGIALNSYGPILVANLTASENGLLGGSGGGARFANHSAASPQKVTLTGANVFNGNYSTGLSVTSLGAISVANLSASGNNTYSWAHGAVLDNDALGAVGGVTLTGSSTLNDNALYGLEVTSNGAIAVNTTRLEASRNGSGAWGGGVSLSNSVSPLTTPPGVTLKGVSTLNDNRDFGLYVETKGAITLNSLAASGNGTDGSGYGANLYNGYPGSSAGITLSGTNAFNDNAGHGLSAESRGPITVSNLTASSNGVGGSFGDGARLTNTGALAGSVQPVKLTGYGTFHDNLGSGLSIYSRGAISAANLTAGGNQSAGAVLGNGGADAVGGVTLSGTNAFDGNAYDGLSVGSLGAITLNNLTASGNGTSGSGNGAYVENSSGLTPQPVKLTGYGTFLDNRTNGLLVYSSGSISAANLTARNNADGHGVSLFNSYVLPSNPGITLSGTNVFTGNGDSGLFAQTNSALTLSKITADDNLGSGVVVNWAASLTITCGSFTHNVDYGLYVGSPVSPILIGVFASGNDVDLYWTGGPITSIVRACPLN